jgi:uncharacterized protein YbjT (DUF2867 family)
MEIVVAGGHGQIAMLLHPLLVEKGHRVRALIRNPEQVAAVRAVGVEPVMCDLEADGDVAGAVGSADAVVFAAGAGPGSGLARKTAMDRDGAIKLIEAAQRNDISRYVMISAYHAEEPSGGEIFQAYLRAKSEADAALRASGLDYTIVRPGKLNDEPARGLVRVAPRLPDVEISRADVAAVVAYVLQTPATIGQQFELGNGEQKIADAIASL